MTRIETEPDTSRPLIAAAIAAAISMEAVVLAVPGRYGLGKTLAFLIVLFPHVYLIVHLSESISTFSVGLARKFGRTVFWGTIVLLLLPVGPWYMPLAIWLFALKTRGYMILALLSMILSNWVMIELAKRITLPGDEPADNRWEAPLVRAFLVIIALCTTLMIVRQLRAG